MKSVCWWQLLVSMYRKIGANRMPPQAPPFQDGFQRSERQSHEYLFESLKRDTYTFSVRYIVYLFCKETQYNHFFSYNHFYCIDGIDLAPGLSWGAFKNEWHLKHNLFTFAWSMIMQQSCTRLLYVGGSFKREQGLKKLSGSHGIHLKVAIASTLWYVSQHYKLLRVWIHTNIHFWWAHVKLLFKAQDI